jgi:hypothetical protein
MTMVDRVVEAIKADMQRQAEVPISANDEISYMNIPSIAKAAIKAMRDPTKAMLAADTHTSTLSDNSILTVGPMVMSWQRMIDAALKNDEQIKADD